MQWMLMPYQRYAEFSGRSRRMEYWMFTLFQVIVAIVLVIVGFVLAGGPPSEGQELSSIAYMPIFLFIIASFIPSLAVQVRRLHDQGLSGWFVLLGFIPYIGGIIMLVFMCIDGKRGPNQYGPDPKGDIDPSVFS